MAGLGLSIPAPRPVNIGGVLNMQSVGQVMAQRASENKSAAAQQAQQPAVTGLAGYVQKCWDLAKRAKLPVEQKMLRALRARRGEYEADKLARIREQGGSEIYMMLFSTKARQAGALLRDVLMGAGTEKPWTLHPSAIPDIDPQVKMQIMQDVFAQVQQAEMSGIPMQVSDIRQMLRDARDAARMQMEEEARWKAENMERKMFDQQQEGGFLDAIDQFIDDLTMYPTAFLKGPVLRRKTRMTWINDRASGFQLQVTDEIIPEWERVDPFMMYPAPWSRGVDDAWLIERHQLSPVSLERLIGIEGYSEDAIRSVLDEFGQNGLRNWLAIDTARPQAEGRENVQPLMASDLIDAIQFWGPVSGKMLIDNGVDPATIDDPSKHYEAEIWLIGRYVIKAALNRDPANRRNYFATGYERVPGVFWHNSLFMLIEDICDMCNGVARALANNVGIASGPQVAVNVSRLPAGYDISQLYPWKVHQFTSDEMGSTAPAIDFFQPQSNAQELMSIYTTFSLQADEVSGIPRYMTGTEGTPGAGRTASGLSMMIGNASKTIKNVLSNIDVHVLDKLLDRQYLFNMRYSNDPDLKGDVNIVARGALSLTTKEAAQVRINELLQSTANPIDMQIIGLPGRAALLREATKNLDMNVDKVIPSESVVKARAAQAAIQQAQMAQMEQAQGNPSSGGSPAKPGGHGQQLMNHAPVTDHFSPQPVAQ